METIAIVTGASSGMGEEFCKQLDSKGLDSIWLVARRKELMESIADSLKTSTRIFAMDLTDRSCIDSLLETVGSERPNIRYLVNCAGFGKFGMTWELPRETTRSMIDLNVCATVDITDGCIPFMENGGHIIELDSASAYIPMYYLNVYASTKAFVKHYCNALKLELKEKGITVTEVSPGWVKTEFIDITVTENNVPPRVFNGAVTKEDVVRKALIAADKGKKRSVCGIKNKLIVSISYHFPGLASRLWKGFFH